MLDSVMEAVLGHWSWMPALSPSMTALIRIALAALSLGFLAWSLPNWRRFFVCERWGGYVQRSPLAEILFSPAGSVLLGAAWAACQVALLMDLWTVWAALLNAVICRILFIWTRWRSVGRGCGAPGFMTWWLSLSLFLVLFTERCAPQLSQLALLVIQVDLAFIIASSGTYKCLNGYRIGEGMNYGMCNPMWGYWWRTMRLLSTRHPVFTLQNQAAWSSQLVAAALMLIPPTRWLGGALLAWSFVLILLQIRLGFLAEQMIVTGLFFATAGSPPDAAVGHLLPTPAPALTPAPTWIVQAAGAWLWFHLLAIPLCHAALSWNFYGRRRLPEALQWCIDRYTNFFGMLVWRVFTADLIDFVVHVRVPEAGGQWRECTAWSPRHPRWWHVCESITLTSLFTARRYWPENPELFQARLLRHARTVGPVVEYELEGLRQVEGRWTSEAVMRYRVECAAGTVTETVLAPWYSPTRVHRGSRVHGMSSRPGSYAPAARTSS